MLIGHKATVNDDVKSDCYPPLLLIAGEQNVGDAVIQERNHSNMAAPTNSTRWFHR